MDISFGSNPSGGDQADTLLLQDLIAMGFGENRSKRGLIMTHNRSADDAVNWILEHGEDVDIDDPIPPQGLKVPNKPSGGLSYRHHPQGQQAVSAADLAAIEAAAETSFNQMAISDYIEYKMVFCVRQDLGMSTGKVAAQCAHAALGLYKRLHQSNPRMLSDWEHAGEKKVVVMIGSQQELEELEKKAFMLSVPTHTVRDAGRTEVEPGTKTVLAVAGPDYAVNQVTGHLKLLK